MAEDVVEKPWFAIEDDLIGGWCVTTSEVSPSQVQDPRGYWVGGFLSEEVARHIVALHNG